MEIEKIRDLFLALEQKEISPNELIFVGKERDDARFPDFESIYAYVSAINKTEAYFERLNRSLEQIELHLETPFSKRYSIDLKHLENRIKEQDKDLKIALKTLGVWDVEEKTKSLLAPSFPEMSLEYREIPNERLLPLAKELLLLLRKISEKSKRLIRQNNIYGFDYQERRKLSFSLPKSLEEETKKQLQTLRKEETELSFRKPKVLEEETAKLLLEEAIKNAKAIQAKAYEIDLFSDGFFELCELLDAIWSAIRLLFYLPILEQQESYFFSKEEGEEEAAYCESEMQAAFQKMLAPRYAELNAFLFSEDFLRGKDPNECYDLYQQLLVLDVFRSLFQGKKDSLPIGKSEQQLLALVGLGNIKESVKKIKAYALANQGSRDLNLHMCFYGNPGTGKTEVARLIAGILYENKILPSNHVVEVDRSGLVGQYVGETPQKTMEVIEEAMGGVLFIDEAYSLVQEQELYGKEAVATLLKAMEDYRGKFCVIFAGYSTPLKKMIESNPGLPSRIQFHLDFSNYSREELSRIAELMLLRRNYSIEKAALERLLDAMDLKRKEANFANARELRNALEQVIMCQNLRVSDATVRDLSLVDVNRYLLDCGIRLPMADAKSLTQKMLSGEEELEQLIGLSNIKRMVKKIKAYAKRNEKEPDFNLHMCFYGNPGTGKTEVARLISRILYENGVLSEAKLIETDASGLIGSYVGQTAPKTQEKIQDALGGVLFIDEAYALMQGNSGEGQSGSYGEEAIAVLLKEMEDKRGKLCVILAGYQNEMKELLKSNPGFPSRIQFHLEFPDYSREELGKLARLFLKKKHYQIEEAALERLLDVAEEARKWPNFANARTIRNLVNQVILNQNLRAEDDVNDSTVILEDVEEYIQEEKISFKETTLKRIGF